MTLFSSVSLQLIKSRIRALDYICIFYATFYVGSFPDITGTIIQNSDEKQAVVSFDVTKRNTRDSHHAADILFFLDDGTCLNPPPSDFIN